MCLYRASFDGRKNVKSFQFRMRGMSLMPSKWAKPNTGVDFIWTGQGVSSESTRTSSSGSPPRPSLPRLLPRRVGAEAVLA
jgi:hypothetical protein